MEVKNQHQQLYKPPANIHQTTSRPTSPNNPPEIHNVLVSTGTPFKSITSSTNYPISDRQSKASKTRKKNKSSSRFLSPHRSETETSFLATSGPSFKSIHSSSTHPSSDRSENLSQTEKKKTSQTHGFRPPPDRICHHLLTLFRVPSSTSSCNQSRVTTSSRLQLAFMASRELRKLLELGFLATRWNFRFGSCI